MYVSFKNVKNIKKYAIMLRLVSDVLVSDVLVSDVLVSDVLLSDVLVSDVFSTLMYS